MVDFRNWSLNQDALSILTIISHLHSVLHSNPHQRILIKASSVSLISKGSIVLPFTNFSKSFRKVVFIKEERFMWDLWWTLLLSLDLMGLENLVMFLMLCFASATKKASTMFSIFVIFLTERVLRLTRRWLTKTNIVKLRQSFYERTIDILRLQELFYPDEQQIFLIDGEEYPEKVYQNFLVKNNINFITSNFAIWQGEIDKMLLKSPRSWQIILRLFQVLLFSRNNRRS